MDKLDRCFVAILVHLIAYGSFSVWFLLNSFRLGRLSIPIIVFTTCFTALSMSYFGRAK